MSKEQPLKIKGTFEDVLGVAGKYEPRDKKAKKPRCKATAKGEKGRSSK